MLEALRRQKPEHVPVWLMSQAGWYLLEYRELRSRAGRFLDLRYDTTLAA